MCREAELLVVQKGLIPKGERRGTDSIVPACQQVLQFEFIHFASNER